MLRPEGDSDHARCLPIIPFAALAAALSCAAQDDSMALGNETMNAVDAAGIEAEMAGNVTAAEAPRPAWLSDGGMWLWAAEEAAGSVWYFDAFGSDFTTSPYRVELRIDHTPDGASPYHNTAMSIELDCAGRRSRIIETTEYAEPGLASPTDVRRHSNLTPIAPGDFFAQIADTVCSHAETQYGPITNAM